MEIYFLGTGAGTPSRQRNVTSSVLNLSAETGSCWMFDCGEGTQHQVLKSPVRLGKINKLFITHLHGDHIFGIPGLLSSRSNQGAKTALTIYGPPGIETFIRTALQVSQSRLDYELMIHEIGEGVVFEEDRFTVTAGKVDHRIDSYGYRIVEKDQRGKLNADKLRKLGIEPGPVYSQLKKGESVTLADGRLLLGEYYLGPSLTGRIVAIIGDTRRNSKAIELARDADVFVHEATFSSEHGDLAHNYGHSTAKEAAESAREANAKRLILTHISSRYQDCEFELLDEAKAVFPNVWLAHDMWGMEIPLQRLEIQ